MKQQQLSNGSRGCGRAERSTSCGAVLLNRFSGATQASLQLDKLSSSDCNVCVLLGLNTSTGLLKELSRRAWSLHGAANERSLSGQEPQ